MSGASIAWARGWRQSNEGLRAECNPYRRYTERTEWARGFAAASKSRALKVGDGRGKRNEERGVPA